MTQLCGKPLTKGRRSSDMPLLAGGAGELPARQSCALVLPPAPTRESRRVGLRERAAARGAAPSRHCSAGERHRLRSAGHAGVFGRDAAGALVVTPTDAEGPTRPGIPTQALEPLD